MSDVPNNPGLKDRPRLAGESAAPVGSAASVVAVIGMHRSGTSMVARMVNLAGFDIGEEGDLLPASDFNKVGHWENRDFVGFNEQLLTHFRGDVFAPPLLPEGWRADPAVTALQHEASEVVRQKFGDRSAWCFKDPRATLFLPFWREVTGVRRFILLVRNPLDVAASLTARDRLTKRHGLALWALYNRAALASTSPEERLLLHYEQCLADPEAAINRVFGFLAESGAAADPERIAQMRAHMNRDLSHHSHRPEDVSRDPEAPASVKELYQALLADPERAAQRCVEDSSRPALLEAYGIAGAEAACHWSAMYQQMRLDRIQAEAHLSQQIDHLKGMVQRTMRGRLVAAISRIPGIGSRLRQAYYRARGLGEYGHDEKV